MPTSDKKEKSKTSKKDKGFEYHMTQLKTLVQKLEEENLPLEDSLNAFELGIHHSKHCHLILKNAELTITQLTEENAELFEEVYTYSDDLY